MNFGQGLDLQLSDYHCYTIARDIRSYDYQGYFTNVINYYLKINIVNIQITQSPESEYKTSIRHLEDIFAKDILKISYVPTLNLVYISGE